MSPASFSAPSSRPSGGYVPPRGVLSPSHAPTKLHKRVDIRDLPIQAISSGLYLDIVIAQRFTNQDLLVYHDLLSCPQSLPAWVAIHDEIAMKLAGRPLFPGLPEGVPEESREMSHDDFSSCYAPGLSQDTSLIIPMLHFFHHLHTKFGVKSMS